MHTPKHQRIFDAQPLKKHQHKHRLGERKQNYFMMILMIKIDELYDHFVLYITLYYFSGFFGLGCVIFFFYFSFLLLCVAV